MEEEGGWEGGDGRGAVKRGEGAGGGEGGRGGGDLPRTVCTPALLSHLSPSTISLWLAELIMEKCVCGGVETGLWRPTSAFPWRSDKFSSSQRPRGTADLLVRAVSFIRRSRSGWQLFRCVNNAGLYKNVQRREQKKRFPLLLEKNDALPTLTLEKFTSFRPLSRPELFCWCVAFYVCVCLQANQWLFSVSIILAICSHLSTSGSFAGWRLNSYSRDLGSRLHLSSYFLNTLGCFLFFFTPPLFPPLYSKHAPRHCTVKFFTTTHTQTHTEGFLGDRLLVF